MDRRLFRVELIVYTSHLLQNALIYYIWWARPIWQHLTVTGRSRLIISHVAITTHRPERKKGKIPFFYSPGSLSACILELIKFIVQIAAWEMCIMVVPVFQRLCRVPMADLFQFVSFLLWFASLPLPSSQSHHRSIYSIAYGRVNLNTLEM